MHDRKPSDVGFCAVDANADLIANSLVRRVRDAAAEMEAQVNRLYRGRTAYQVSDLARLDLDKTIRRLSYLAETLREVERAQDEPVRYLEAAE